MRKLAATAVLMFGLAACGEAEPANSWLAIPDTYPHEVVESTGIEGGQLVVVLDTSVTRQEVLDVGRIILSQAPPDITVNARLYDDLATARNWRTVDAQRTLEHLLVVARRTESGGDDVRWVGPSPADSAAAQAADSAASAQVTATDPSSGAAESVTPP